MAILQSSLASCFVPHNLSSRSSSTPSSILPPNLTASPPPAPLMALKVRQQRHLALITHATKDQTTAALDAALDADIQQVAEVQKAPEVVGLQPAEGVADRWRELHGTNDWRGLLDPMDKLLRSELIRYGEFVQACYDAFDKDKYSRYCGTCKFIRRHFFSNLGKSAVGYDVTRYLYATSNVRVPKFFVKSSVAASRAWSERANWIGYVAVSDDATTARLGRRDILIAWRGTVMRVEWIHDFMAKQLTARSAGIPAPNASIKVESGFVDLYVEKDPDCRFCKYSAREQVLTEVKKLVEKYTGAGEEVSISVVGHSLGSALATLNAYDIAEMKLDRVGASGSTKKASVAVFSFGGPRVGNEEFKARVKELGVKVLRVRNAHDLVPRAPGVMINENVPEFMRRGALDGYVHVGVELVLDHKHSPYLDRESADPGNFHNMEAHLHLLDGYHGKGAKFELASGRDPALVNKDSSFLAEHLLVPPYWRQDLNKGMIVTQEGRWTQPERERPEDHPDDTHYHYEQLGLHQASPPRN